MGERRENHWVACVIAHLHAKPYGAVGHRLPDPSHSDNPQRFARDFRSQELRGAPAGPTTGSNEGVAFDDAACRRQEQGPGQIRGGIRQDVRGIGDDQTTLSRCGKIDVVVPHSVVRQNFQPSGCMNGFGVDAVAQGHDRGVGLAESLTQRGWRRQCINRFLHQLEPFPHDWP